MAAAADNAPGLRPLYRAEVAIDAPLEVGELAAGSRRVIRYYDE